MCLEKLPPFGRIIVYAVLGVACGIAFGLVFSLVIAWISMQLHNPQLLDGPPIKDYGFASFLGMGFGAIIGAIVGAAHGNKK